MNCETTIIREERGGYVHKCQICGKEYWGPFKRFTIPCGEATERAQCIHLGEQTRIKLIKCKTCRGNVRQKFSVHACAIFGECLPTYRGDEPNLPSRCAGCNSYTPIQSVAVS